MSSALDDRIVILSTNLGIGNVDVAPVHTLSSDPSGLLQLSQDTGDPFTFDVRGAVDIQTALRAADRVDPPAGAPAAAFNADSGGVTVGGALDVWGPGATEPTLRVGDAYVGVGVGATFAVGSVLAVATDAVAVQGDLVVGANFGTPGAVEVVNVSVAQRSVTVDGSVLVAGASTFEGTVTAAAVVGGNVAGRGAGLWALNVSNVSSGTLEVARGGTGVAQSTGTGALVLNASPTLQGAVSVAGNVVVTGQISGNGYGLTSVNLGNTTGVLAVARGGTGTTASTGTGAVALNVAPVFTGVVTAGGIVASGAGLSALNASNVSTGTLAVSRGGTGVAASTGSGAVTLNVAPVLEGPVTVVGDLRASTLYGNVRGQTITVDGFAATVGAFQTIAGNLDASFLTGDVDADVYVDVQDWVPVRDNAFALGSATRRWANVFTASVGAATATFGAVAGDAWGLANVNAANIVGLAALTAQLADISANSLTFTGMNTTITSPGANLISFSTSGAAAMRIDPTGNVYATGDFVGMSNLSDARLKGNVRGMLAAIDTLANLRPVSFTWNDAVPFAPKRGQRDVGLIAQDVAGIFPYAHFFVDNTLQGLRYERFVPLLIAALQEEVAARRALERALVTLQTDVNKFCVVLTER